MFREGCVFMFSIEAKNLKFSYRQSLVLKGLNFSIKKGAFVSIIGPNGSGKSTLLKTLNNLYMPDSGDILIEGKNVEAYRRRDLAKIIGFVPQETSIDYEFTVEDIVMMGRHPYKGRFQKEDKKDYKIVNDVMKMTNTFNFKDSLITEISGGERQRVIIAKALAQNPSIILLDEPTSHLDINHQIELLNLLRTLNREKGTTIVLVIHDINLAARFSDDIILLYDGEIIGSGNPEKVITVENIRKAYNLDVAIEKNKYTNTISLTPLNFGSMETVSNDLRTKRRIS